MNVYAMHVECCECGVEGEVVHPKTNLMGQSVVSTETRSFLKLLDREICMDCLYSDD